RQEFDGDEDQNRRGEEGRNPSEEADHDQPCQGSLLAASDVSFSFLRQPGVPEAIPPEERERMRLQAVDLLREAVDRLLEERDHVAAVVPEELLGRECEL